MLNTNFIKNQILPSKYLIDHQPSTQLYLYNNGEYIPLTLTNSSGLYIKQDESDYRMVSSIKPAYNAQGFNADMEFLNNKLNQATKRVNALDFYRITNVVQDSSKFAAAVSSLVPNTGLIIDAPTFTAPDKNTYTRGDIVFKYNDLSTVKVTAERGGIFYPQQITKDTENNNYTIQYNFINTQPSDNNVFSVVPNANVGDASEGATHKKIAFTGVTSEDAGILYNVIAENPSVVRFTAKRVGVNLIRPNIKMFADSGSSREEVYVEYTLNYDANDDEWVISNIPNIVSYLLVK